nr:MAG TPA: hypothetical protein [Caudoviricetes sp.]
MTSYRFRVTITARTLINNKSTLLNYIQKNTHRR